MTVRRSVATMSTTNHPPRPSFWRAPTMAVPTPAPDTTQERSLTDRLRQDIIAGNLVPHQRLIEADVAAEHGASRGDVRLALNELISEGLVERIPNRGARVRKVSLQAAIEITEVRGAVESRCAGKAAAKITGAQATGLRGIGEQMQCAVDRRARDASSTLNRPLHGRSTGLARPQRAAEPTSRLRGRAVRSPYQLGKQADRPHLSLRQHAASSAGMWPRDADGAAAAMQAHLA